MLLPGVLSFGVLPSAVFTAEVIFIGMLPSCVLAPGVLASDVEGEVPAVTTSVELTEVTSAAGLPVQL